MLSGMIERPVRGAAMRETGRAKEVVVRNLTKMTAPGGVLFLCQSFPNCSAPFIGKEAIASPDELVGRFHGGFELERWVHCQEFSPLQDGPLYMALLRKKTRKEAL